MGQAFEHNPADEGKIVRQVLKSGRGISLRLMLVVDGRNGYIKGKSHDSIAHRH